MSTDLQNCCCFCCGSVFSPFFYDCVFFKGHLRWHTSSDYATVFRDFLLNSIDFRAVSTCWRLA